MKHFFMTLTLLLAASLISANNTIWLNDNTADPDPTRDVEYLDNGVIVTYRFSSVSVKDDPLFANAKTAQNDCVKAKKQSGIGSSLNADNEKMVIYDISGRRIHTSSHINKLEKGIYIINGEKVIIK